MKFDIVTMIGASAILLSTVGLGTVAVRMNGAAGAVHSQQSSQNRSEAATELISVLIVSSNCPASRAAELKRALPRIDSLLRDLAARTDRRYVRVAVSVDPLPSAALAFIGELGEFDEVIAGGGWANTGALMYILQDFPGPMSIPQFLVLEREVSSDGRRLTVGGGRLLTRNAGFRAITAMADQADLSMLLEVPVEQARSNGEFVPR